MPNQRISGFVTFSSRTLTKNVPNSQETQIAKPRPNVTRVSGWTMYKIKNARNHPLNALMTATRKKRRHAGWARANDSRQASTRCHISGGVVMPLPAGKVTIEYNKSRHSMSDTKFFIRQANISAILCEMNRILGRGGYV